MNANSSSNLRFSTVRSFLSASCFGCILTVALLGGCADGSPEAPASPGLMEASEAGAADSGASDGSDAASGPGNHGDASTSDADAAPGAITTPNETPGTRLKPQYDRFTFGEGAEWLTFRHLLDTQRNELCVPQTLSDGQLHCAPPGEEAYYMPDTYFADPTCGAQPVIGTARQLGAAGSCDGSPAPQTTSRYFLLPNADACGPVRLVAFPQSPPLAVSTIYMKSGAACTAVSVSPTSQYTYEIYASPPLPLAEVSPSSFVTITRTDTTASTPTRLRALSATFVGDDGSSFTSPNGFLVDSLRNELCAPNVGTDGTVRCMPAAGEVMRMSDFSDPSCTQPDFMVSNNKRCTSDARYTFTSYMEQPEPAATGCPGNAIYPRFTSALTRTYYAAPGGQCLGQNLGSDTSYTHYGAPSLPAPIPPSTFADLSIAELDSPNGYYAKSGARIRFKAYTYQSSDGFSTPMALMAWDAQNGPCYPGMLMDGNVYCVPYAIGSFDFDAQRGNLFADAACSVPVLGVNTSGAACLTLSGLPAPTMYAESSTLGSCSTLRPFRLPATPLSDPTLYGLVNGVCTAYSGNTSQDVFYRRSDAQEVQPTEFVPVSASRVTAP